MTWYCDNTGLSFYFVFLKHVYDLCPGKFNLISFLLKLFNHAWELMNEVF